MRVPVTLKSESCDIILERGCLKKAASLLGLHGRVFLITDSGIPADYIKTVAAQCHPVSIERIPTGESSKSTETLEILLRAMLREGLDRDDCVLALGGGVVGDLSGFAASCYMRGIDFYNIPTTVLSQVDSSIGGKTGINFAGVKNCIGAFYQPKRVLIDPNVLRTLSPRLLHEGLAESIKMAVTCDAVLFHYLTASPLSDTLLDTVIERSLRIKASIVEKDPHETGLRRVLNFGHTIGHAIEACCGGQYLHGECVAMGMLPMCSPEVRRELKAVLEKWELPTGCPVSAEKLLPYLMHDKKKSGDRIYAVSVDEIGSYIMKAMTPQELCQRWEDAQ